MKRLMFVAVAAALTGCVSVHKNDGGNEIVHPDIFTRDAVKLSYALDQNAVSATETIHWLNIGIIPFTFTWGGTADHIADFAPMGVKLPFGRRVCQGLRGFRSRFRRRHALPRREQELLRVRQGHGRHQGPSRQDYQGRALRRQGDA